MLSVHVQLFTAIFLAWVCFVPTANAGERDHIIPVSIAAVHPWGDVATALNASTGLGLSLGYSYAVTRTLGLGAAGVWSRSSIADTGKGLSTYHLLATIRLRMLKHGTSPYLQIEGGFGITDVDEQRDAVRRLVPELGTATASAGIRAGVVIRMSPHIDVDIHGRYAHTFMQGGLSQLGLHAGITYSPQF